MILMPGFENIHLTKTALPVGVEGLLGGLVEYKRTWHFLNVVSGRSHKGIGVNPVGDRGAWYTVLPVMTAMVKGWG